MELRPRPAPARRRWRRPGARGRRRGRPARASDSGGTRRPAGSAPCAASTRLRSRSGSLSTAGSASWASTASYSASRPEPLQAIQHARQATCGPREPAGGTGTTSAGTRQAGGQPRVTGWSSPSGTARSSRASRPAERQAGVRRRTAPGPGRCRPSTRRRPGAPEASTPIAAHGTRPQVPCGERVGAPAPAVSGRRGYGSRDQAVAQRPLPGQPVERVGRARSAGGGRRPRRRHRPAPRPSVRRHAAGRNGLAVVRRRCRRRGGRAVPSGRRRRRRHTSRPATSPDSTPCSSTGSAPAASITVAQRGDGRRERRRHGQGRRVAGRSARPSISQTVGAGANAAARRASDPGTAFGQHVERRAVVSVGPGQRAAEAGRADRPRAAPRPRRRRSSAARAGQRADRAEFDVAGRAGVVADEGLQLQRPQQRRGGAARSRVPVVASTSSRPCARRSGAGTARPGRRSRPASACR